MYSTFSQGLGHCLKFSISGAGEMNQWLKVHTTHAEILSWIPSAHSGSSHLQLQGYLMPL